MSKFIRASSLFGLEAIAKTHLQDLASQLVAVGLSTDQFQLGEAEIPFSKASTLLENCSRDWRIPHLGVELSKHQALDNLGVVALATRMERNVRDAVRAVLRNFFIHTNAFTIELREFEGSKIAECHLDFRDADIPHRQYLELELCRARFDVEALALQPVKFFWVTVPHQAPTARDRLAEALSCPVRYGESGTVIHFDSAILDVPMAPTDTTFHPLIRRYLKDAASEGQGDFAEMVRLEVFRQLSTGQCGQDSVAESLGMQVRAMQRRLKALGTSFREILDAERKRKALGLLQHTVLPLSEVAYALGYSDQTAFNQAFRRWFGKRPLAVRKGLT